MTTNFDEIVFNPDRHTYTYHGRRLDSVTSITKRLQKPFDREGQALRTAEKTGRTVVEVLAEWDEAGRLGREKGRRFHEHVQAVLSGGLDIDDPMQRPSMAEALAFNVFWQERRRAYAVNRVEWIIGDEALGIAGTADAVLNFQLEPGGVVLMDWKTGKFSQDNKWQKLLPPFDDLDDCKLNEYSLQVSLYWMILERNTDLGINKAYVAHFGADGEYQVYPAVDLRGRLWEWLGASR